MFDDEDTLVLPATRDRSGRLGGLYRALADMRRECAALEIAILRQDRKETTAAGNSAVCFWVAALTLFQRFSPGVSAEDARVIGAKTAIHSSLHEFMSLLDYACARVAAVPLQIALDALRHNLAVASGGAFANANDGPAASKI